jgi:hypothetical protein
MFGPVSGDTSLCESMFGVHKLAVCDLLGHLLGGWANGIPSWPPAKPQQSPPKLAPRVGLGAWPGTPPPPPPPPPLAPRSRPTEQQQAARAGGAQEKEVDINIDLQLINLICQSQGLTWPCTELYTSVEAGLLYLAFKTHHSRASAVQYEASGCASFGGSIRGC